MCKERDRWDCHLSVDAGAPHVSSNGVVANQVVRQHSLILRTIFSLSTLVCAPADDNYAENEILCFYLRSRQSHSQDGQSQPKQFEYNVQLCLHWRARIHCWILLRFTHPKAKAELKLYIETSSYQACGIKVIYNISFWDDITSRCLHTGCKIIFRLEKTYLYSLQILVKKIILIPLLRAWSCRNVLANLTKPIMPNTLDDKNYAKCHQYNTA